jgi:hypothetical protein
LRGDGSISPLHLASEHLIGQLFEAALQALKLG